ncbi:hypothetical protein Ljor_0047 [Legionella jordanis]|uniref:N-acetyltransferase domain-containing protein n=1 Tax=Legionella jordanis TaxID=456 RepID=A0A0W0VHD6_9GAMM|nr:GNAT family N-acetyltransferase [Legionella jordanis]KTD19081.1 hypothetical protein Ljor_0047 [Legionella jordanis]VEH12956.1 Uncharacterised protein [Legionella jordanis]
MFYNNREVAKKEQLKFEEIFDNNGKNEHHINILSNKKIVGHCIYKDRKDGDIDFTWIEVKEEFRGNGFASKCLDYICQKALMDSRALIINVVDEEVLSNFYFKWFKRRVNPNDIDDYDDEVLDYFNNLVTNEDKYLNAHHPTLVLKPEDINWTPDQKPIFSNK